MESLAFLSSPMGRWQCHGYARIPPGVRLGASPGERRGPIPPAIARSTATALGIFPGAVTALKGVRTRKKCAATATPGFFKRNTLQPLTARRHGIGRSPTPRWEAVGLATQRCGGSASPLLPACFLRLELGTGRRAGSGSGSTSEDREAWGHDHIASGNGVAATRVKLEHHREIRSGAVETPFADFPSGPTHPIRTAAPAWRVRSPKPGPIMIRGTWNVVSFLIKRDRVVAFAVPSHPDRSPHGDRPRSDSGTIAWYD